MNPPDILRWIETEYAKLPDDLKAGVKYLQLSVQSPSRMEGAPAQIQICGWPGDGLGFETAYGQTVEEAVASMRKIIERRNSSAELLRESARKLMAKADQMEVRT